MIWRTDRWWTHPPSGPAGSASGLVAKRQEAALAETSRCLGGLQEGEEVARCGWLARGGEDGADIADGRAGSRDSEQQSQTGQRGKCAAVDKSGVRLAGLDGGGHGLSVVDNKR